MAERVTIVVDVKDEASKDLGHIKDQVTQTAAAVDKAGAAAGRASAGWAAAGTATSKAGGAVAAVGKTATTAASTVEKATAKQGTALSRLGGVAVAASTRMGKALADNPLLTGVGLAGVGLFAASAIKSFANVEDSIAALRSSTGAAADTIIDWANQSGDAFNVSRESALQAGQSFATFGKSAGLAGNELAGFTTGLLERAADLASFRGGNVADAVIAMGAALRGEAEPIRAYGVLLDDATLRQRAFSMGLIRTTTQALTPQQKVLASYTEILAQTTDAAGDAARTQDSLANKIKDGQQQWADLKTNIGETAAVAAGPLLSAANGAMDAFNDLPGPIRTAATATAALGAAALIAAPKVLALKAAMSSAGPTGMAMAKGFGIAAAAAIGAEVAFGAMHDPIASLLGQDAAPVDQFATALASVGKASADAEGLLAGAGIPLQDLGEAMTEARNNASPLVDAMNLLIPPMRAFPEPGEKVAESFKNMDTALTAMVSSGNAAGAAAAFDTLASAASHQGKSIEDLKALLPGYATVAAASFDAAGAAAAGATGKVGALAAAMNTTLAQTSPWLGQQAAIEAYRATVLDARDALKENGSTLDAWTRKGQANRTALLSVAAAAKAAYVTTDELGNPIVTNAKAYGQSAVQLYRMARGMGMSTRAAARFLTESLGAAAAAKALGRVQAKPRIKADISDLETKLARAKAKVAMLQAIPGQVGVKADIRDAQAKVSTLQRELGVLQGDPTSPTITADNSPALSAIAATRQALTDLDGTSAYTHIYTVRHESSGGGGKAADAGDTGSPRGRGVGSLAATMARHAELAGALGGGYKVTNLLVGGGGRGYGSGDHQAGRAVDVQGPRLGAYVQAVRAAGGFAELHGTGGGRHAHAVLGDTASPRRAATSGGGGDQVQVGPFYFTGVTGQDQRAIRRTVEAGIREYLQQRKERGV